MIVNVQALISQDATTGDTHGSSVEYKYSISTDSGPFIDYNAGSKWVTAGTVAVTDGYPTAVRGASHRGVGASFSIYPTAGSRTADKVVIQPQYLNGSVWTDMGQEVTMSTSFSIDYSVWDELNSDWTVIQTPSEPVWIAKQEDCEKIRAKIIKSSAFAHVAISGDVMSMSSTINVVITGKTKSLWQRSDKIKLPKPGSNWVIRLTRLTPDSETSSVLNAIGLQSYTEIIDSRLSYPNSAYIGVTIDAKQFSTVPSRSYLVNGVKIKLPSNYNPITRIYSGTWDGTLNNIAVSNNPAWVMYDMLTKKRYGLGRHLVESQIDKTALYTIGRFCDELVPDGHGGMEPRFTINTSFQSQAEAYKLISDISSVFRGMAYWSGDMVNFSNDAPTDASAIFTPANVIDGVFNYAGSARKDRHSVVLVTWNDPSQGYKQQIEYVENAELIKLYGIRKAEVIGFGCTSRGQANRLGKWMLYTEQYESDMITFKVGLDASFLSPGEVIKINDPTIAGKRMGGRLVNCTATSATLDAPITLADGVNNVLSLRLPDGAFVDREILQGVGTFTTVTWASPLAAVALPNAMWIIAEQTLTPLLARVIGIKDEGANTFEVTVVQHNPSKYAAIDAAEPIREENTHILIVAPPPPPPPTAISAEDITYQISPGVFGVKTIISWVGDAPSYEISYRNDRESANWVTLRTQFASYEITGSSGTYEIKICSLNAFGRASKHVSFTHVSTLGSFQPISEIVVNLRGSSWGTPNCDIYWGNAAMVAGYDVEVWSDAVLLRTEHVASENYSYTFDKNVADGGPRRSLLFKVYIVSAISGLRSATPATLATNNAQIGAPSGVTMEVGLLSLEVKCDQPTDADWGGMVLWASKTPGFTPGLANQVFVGKATSAPVSIALLDPNDVWYARVGLYDVFGLDLVTPSSEVFAHPAKITTGMAPGEIVSANIAAGAVTAEQLKVKRHYIV
jgi:hypothetical protein